MSPFRSYRGSEDPSPFMGLIKKLSFNAGQMNAITGGVTRLRGKTKDGEVELMRVGEVDYVTVNVITPVLQIILTFISEFDESNVRSGTDLIYVYDADMESVPVTITEKVSGYVGNEKYTYVIDIPSSYGDDGSGGDGSGGTSGGIKKKITAKSKFFISFGVVTENCIGHVVCPGDYADYSDWASNGGIESGSYKVKVPYFKAIDITTYSSITTPSDPQPWEYRPGYNDYVHGATGLEWAMNYLNQFNCINNPKRPDDYVVPTSYSRVSDSFSSTTTISCSASVCPSITGVLRITEKSTLADAGYQYYRDDNSIEINREGFYVENYERYVSRYVLKPDYWLYDPHATHLLDSSILTDLGSYDQDIPGYPGRTPFDFLQTCLITNTVQDVKSGSVAITYNAQPENSYCGWENIPPWGTGLPYYPCTLKYLCKQIRVFTTGGYTIRYLKNI
jgi:hypothetical protein